MSGNRFRDPGVQVVVVILALFALYIAGHIAVAIERGTFPPSRTTDTQETP